MLRSDLDAETPGVFAAVTADASFTDDGVGPGRSYVYRVVAVNDDGDSPYSDPITVDTPAEPQPDTTTGSGVEPKLSELPEEPESEDNGPVDEPLVLEVLEVVEHDEPLIPQLQLVNEQFPDDLFNVIWRTTMTNGDSGSGAIGFLSSDVSSDSYGSLAEDTFGHDGNDHTVVNLWKLRRFIGFRG